DVNMALADVSVNLVNIVCVNGPTVRGPTGQSLGLTDKWNPRVSVGFKKEKGKGCCALGPKGVDGLAWSAQQCGSVTNWATTHLLSSLLLFFFFSSPPFTNEAGPHGRGS